MFLVDNLKTKSPKTQDDILVLQFGGFATFMLKDRQLWIRLDDIWHFLTDHQRQSLLSSGVGLCDLPGRSFDGEYVLFDVFAALAPANIKPMMQGIKRGVLAVFKRESGKS